MGCCCCSISACCCGQCSLSMQTVNADASVGQSVCGNCGGLSCVSNILNTVGKWGTAITAVASGQAVASGGVVTSGSKSVVPIVTSPKMSTQTIVLILIVVAGIIFLATRS